MSLRNVFTENLKTYRKKAGLSQQKLAEKCDIATNYLSEIERGIKFPSIELIEKFSSVLNTPAYLFLIDDKTTVNSDPALKKRVTLRLIFTPTHTPNHDYKNINFVIY